MRMAVLADLYFSSRRYRQCTVQTYEIGNCAEPFFLNYWNCNDIIGNKSEWGEYDKTSANF